MKKTCSAGAVLAAALLTTATQAQEEKHFQGGFIGGEIGYLDAGDGLNGVYYGANTGFRTQSDSGFVYGLEGTFGTSDVDFGGLDNIIDHQWSVMGTIGKAFGSEKRDLISLGAGFAQVKASAFGVSATGEGFTSSLGYERAIGNNLSFRLRAIVYEDFETVIGTAGLGLRF